MSKHDEDFEGLDIEEALAKPSDRKVVTKKQEVPENKRPLPHRNDKLYATPALKPHSKPLSTLPAVIPVRPKKTLLDDLDAPDEDEDDDEDGGTPFRVREYEVTTIEDYVIPEPVPITQKDSLNTQIDADVAIANGALMTIHGMWKNVKTMNGALSLIREQMRIVKDRRQLLNRQLGKKQDGGGPSDPWEHIP